jgi:branched-chain amino acid transport system permease protein
LTLALDTIVQGILLGGLYCLFAAGLSLIFGVMRLVNLAHGDVIVLAAFALLTLTQRLGLGLLPALLLTAPAMFGLGFVLQYAVLNRVVGRDILPALLITFGLSIFTQNGLLAAFSPDSRRLAANGLESASLTLAPGLSVGIVPLLTMAAAVGVIMALNQLFYRTALGRAFRAVSDDASTAQLMGIDPKRIFAVAMGIAFAVAAIAALCFGVRANFDPSIGPARLIFAFESVIIGGLGSLWGTLAGGIVLGIAQTVGAAINPEWQILAGHLAFMVVLLARPRGLFPRAVD